MDAVQASKREKRLTLGLHSLLTSAYPARETRFREFSRRGLWQEIIVYWTTIIAKFPVAQPGSSAGVKFAEGLGRAPFGAR